MMLPFSPLSPEESGPEEKMLSLSPSLRETITETLARGLAVLWIGGFFVAVESALLKLMP